MRLQTSPADLRSRPSRAGVRWGTLLAIWGTIGNVWCGFLPLVARQPAVKARLDELKAQGIDASAMYYTELPAMDEVLRVMQEHRDHYPEDLWVPVWGNARSTDWRAIDGSTGRN